MNHYKHDVNFLCRIIGVPRWEFYKLSENALAYYRFEEQSKPLGGTRTIAKPKWRLRQLQSKIHKLLAPGLKNGLLYGGIRGRSAKMAAEVHTAKEAVLSLDITDYYGSISHHSVFRLFRNYFGFNNELASRLTKLTTVCGSLPQGAPTSTLLANAHAATTWAAEAQQVCDELGLVMTIFVDDITISGPVNVSGLLPKLKQILANVGLSLNEQKSRYMPAGTRQEVLGYTVNHKVSKRKKWRGKVRAAVHRTVTLPPGEEQHHLLLSVHGKLSHANEVNSGFVSREKRALPRRD